MQTRRQAMRVLIGLRMNVANKTNSAGLLQQQNLSIKKKCYSEYSVKYKLILHITMQYNR